ncbi:hypothetical protein JCM11491_002149 [Sporobolomyces phaffii]
MFSRANSLVASVSRSSSSAVASCSACRSFSTRGATLLAPARPDTTATPASSSTSDASKTRQLLMIMEEASANTPEAGPDQSSLLQHLRRGQVISPQHLSPDHLLTPYLPRPNFALAHPLGPPTAFGETHDPFVRYGIDPLRHAVMNPFWKAEFCTTMGKIKPRGKTGLQRKSQRRVGKAIRRARSMGLIPTFGISVPGQGGERY